MLCFLLLRFVRSFSADGDKIPMPRYGSQHRQPEEQTADMYSIFWTFCILSKNILIRLHAGISLAQQHVVYCRTRQWVQRKSYTDMCLSIVWKNMRAVVTEKKKKRL